MSWIGVSAYGVMMIGGILITARVWDRMSRPIAATDGSPEPDLRPARDSRLVLIYFCGLVGAFVGAKLAFLFAEGWTYRDNWIALLSGRSITGGLLGGYAAVEFGKRCMRYPRATGDRFALVAPIGLMAGRVGCVLQGCCAGIRCDRHWWTVIDAAGDSRWPAAMVELGFNAAFWCWALAATKWGWQRGNRFHVYLIAYGVFRFGHEFLRERQPWIGALGGYHVLALALLAFGLIRYRQRLSEMGRGEAERSPGGRSPTIHRMAS